MIAAAMPKLLDSARHGGALKLHRDRGFGEVSVAPVQPQLPANPPIVRTGTALAISYLTSGVAALSAKSSGRGGAHNRADRESHALTMAQVASLKAAADHAGAIGLPLTRMITIHWEACGVPLAGMAKATGQFTDLMGKALARHGSRAAWLWTHENGDGKGGHCHLLAHVPANIVAKLIGLQKRWLASITGEKYRKRAIHSKPIGGKLNLEVGNPDLHACNLAVVLGYVCKGAPQAILTKLNIDRTHEPGGRVIGKRCGTSQNIGEKQRRAQQVK